MAKKQIEKKKLVSIVIPAYKQEKTIKKDIENIYATMSQTRWNFEIVVVVDGFVDSTMQNAKKVKKDNVFVVGYETNHGKGYAIRYGIARSCGDYIAFIDSGMDIDPNGISMLLEHMEWYKADAMVASKRHPASKVYYPFIRKVYSWGYHTLVKILFGIKLRDTQSGLKVYKREVVERVMPRLVVKKFAFDIEVLAVARSLGYKRIFEAPVEIDWDFRSSNFSAGLIFDRNIQGMLADTIAVFYRLYILRYYNDESRRKWIYDKELEMRINTGGVDRD